MPSDLAQREQRLQAIRDLLVRETIRGQEEIARRLRGLGFEVAQSSVSRDLRDLGVAKVRGRYVLQASVPETHHEPALETVFRASVTSIVTAGPHLVVVKTVSGAASAVGLAIDQARWPEVVGTVAGDDTLFIAIAGRRHQDRLVAHLNNHMEGISEHG